MSCIVADTGPLLMFGRSGLLVVLREIAGDILVPATVFLECTRDTAKPGASMLLDAQAAGPILETWKSRGYFLAPALLHAVLSRAGEV